MMKKTAVLTMAIVVMAISSMMASATYGEMSINDDFTGTSLDTSTWTRENNMTYTISNSMLNIDIDKSSLNDSYIGSTDFVHPQQIHAKTKIVIETQAMQTNNASFTYYTGIAFEQWNLSNMDIEQPQVMGGMVGMSRDNNNGILTIGMVSGTGVVVEYKSFEYANSTTLFGKKVTVEFIYDATFSGSKATTHMEAYLDGEKINSLDAHLYNTTSNMVYAMHMDYPDDPTIKGTLSVDYIKLGAWTGEVGKESNQLPQNSIIMYSVAIFLVTVAFGMVIAKFSEDKRKNTVGIIQGMLVFSLILLTAGAYIAESALPKIYGIDQWMIIGAITIISMVGMWRIHSGGKLFR